MFDYLLGFPHWQLQNYKFCKVQIGIINSVLGFDKSSVRGAKVKKPAEMPTCFIFLVDE
jgi:hypothetical protein